MIKRPDILVAGLGPAGASAAEAAARAGCSVLALERKAEPGFPVQCAEFVPAVIGSEVAGLAASCRQSIEAMTTFVEDDAPDLTANFPGKMIDRRAFDRHLAETAAAAGAECRYGVAIHGIAADGAVRLSTGERIRPRAIIGADGPRSLAGAAIGQVNCELVETRQLTAPLLAPHLATDIFLSADIRGGYGWMFPKGDAANIGLGVRPADRARLKPLLDRLHARLVAEGRVGRDALGHTGGAIPVGGLLHAFGRLGEVAVILAGDAAGLTNPVTGAGISSAVISGGWAGECAAEWLAGDDAAPEAYVDELDFVFRPALDRALRHRARLLATYANGGPDRRDLRRGWIAYPDYWAA